MIASYNIANIAEAHSRRVWTGVTIADMAGPNLVNIVGGQQSSF